MALWTPIDGRVLTVDEVRADIAGKVFNDWKPSGGTLHNTATPSLGRAEQFSIQHWSDMWVGFFKQKGWSGGPHYFCFPRNKVLCFTPITHRGVHSPSWNGTKFGVEMVADFDREDDDAGLGLEVKQAAVAVFAALYAKLGLDPEGIKMHYEDPATTHACPGRDLKKDEFIHDVMGFMGSGGEHPGGTTPPPTTVHPAEPQHGTVTVAVNDTLAMRDQSSQGGRLVGILLNGTKVDIIGDAMNGKTRWLHVRMPETAGDGSEGWVAARYIRT